jgi:hypothetical protein
MYLQDYYQNAHGSLSISREQASDFAKRIAGDFNPIHDATAKRFCVPGDLLFALVLNRSGLRERMKFTFAGMVGEGAQLRFPEQPVDRVSGFSITDDNGKQYLEIECDGGHSSDPRLIHALSKHYVEFSGQTFPHILVPLMASHDVMINPERPLVMYESMIIDMDRLEVEDPVLSLAKTELEVDGKRGKACIEFDIMESGDKVGRGKKNLVLSGLRPFVQSEIDLLINSYRERKQTYANS